MRPLDVVLNINYDTHDALAYKFNNSAISADPQCTDFLQSFKNSSFSTFIASPDFLTV